MTKLPEFLWSVGEECSDPWVLRDGQPYRIDQFAASGHLQHQAADLESIASLNVRHVRYGMPWRPTETSAGHYDWTLWDRALSACHAAGLEPISVLEDLPQGFQSTALLVSEEYPAAADKG